MKIGEHQLIPEPSIPPTTAWTVIFNFDKKAKRYDRDSYSPQLTDGRASTPEVDQVLSQIESIRNPIDSKLNITTILWFGSLLLIILAFAFIFLSDPESDPRILVIPGIAFWIIFLIGLIRTVMLQNRFQNECNNLLKNEVNKKFASRELRWHISTEWPYWLELHNEFRKDSCSARQQTAQQPGTFNQNAVGGQLHLRIYQGEPVNNKNIYNVYVPPSQH